MYLLFQYINKAALTICLTLLFLYACSPSKKTEVSASKYDSIQLKFAKHLNVEPAEIRNLRLYRFINEWLKTPYKWGGTTKAGIDCSAFVERLMADDCLPELFLRFLVLTELKLNRQNVKLNFHEINHGCSLNSI